MSANGDGGFIGCGNVHKKKCNVIAFAPWEQKKPDKKGERRYMLKNGNVLKEQKSREEEEGGWGIIRIRIY